MATAVSQGPRGPVTGVLDNTGMNPGNWTVTFDPAALNCNLPYAEISHIVISGAPGSSFTVYVNVQQWDAVLNGFQNAWDPAVPIPVSPGDYVYFFWSDPATDNTPPTVTIWLRYDQDIVANRNAVYGQAAQGGYQNS